MGINRIEYTKEFAKKWSAEKIEDRKKIIESLKHANKSIDTNNQRSFKQRLKYNAKNQSKLGAATGGIVGGIVGASAGPIGSIVGTGVGTAYGTVAGAIGGASSTVLEKPIGKLQKRINNIRIQKLEKKIAKHS